MSGGAPGRLLRKHFLLWDIQCLSDTPASPFSLSLNPSASGHFQSGSGQHERRADCRDCQVGITGAPLVMVVYRCVFCLCRIRKEFTSTKLSVEVSCGSIPPMCSQCSLSFSDYGVEVRDVHFIAKAQRPVGP